MQIKKHVLRPLFFCALLFLIALAVFIKVPQRERGSARRAPDFVLLVEGIDEIYQPRLHIGDRIVDRQSRRILGTVSAIEAHAATSEIFSEKEGRLIEAPVPGRLNLLLTVSPAEEGETRIGQIYYFRTYDFLGEGRVVRLL